MLNRENKIQPPYTSSASDLIKEAMSELNLNQTDLAKKLDISPDTISAILNRKMYMTKEIALKVEHNLGISSELLLNLDNNSKLCYHSSKDTN